MAEENNRCANEMCNCMVRGDAEYCSTQCESAAEQGLTSIQCECGHTGCAGSV